MPIEIEDKFLLRNNGLEKALRHDLSKYDGTIYEIEQAYIGSEGRIRKRKKTFSHGDKISSPDTEYIFTYKRKLKNRKGSLELESKMDKSDFTLAWNEERTISLVKTRICLHMPWQEIWEIDFFKYDNQTYLVLAECEMSEGQHQPKQMPEIIKENLLYIIPDNDPRFKNRRLANPVEVSKLLSDIAVEISNEALVHAQISLQSTFPR